MLGFCRDPLIVDLQKLGYSLIALPDAGTAPLDCFARQGKGLRRIGKLGELFVPGDKPLPEVRISQSADDLKRRKSGAFDGGLGATMLGRWLGKGKAEVSGKLSRDAKFSFELKTITKEDVSLVALDAFLPSARLNVEGPSVREMIEGDEIYVTTAVLKAKGLTATAEGQSEAEGRVSIPEVEGVSVSGDGSVKMKGAGDRGLVFEAQVPLAFAFQAVQICFVHEAYRALRVLRGSLQLMGNDGLETLPATETGWLSDQMGSSFARIEG